MAPMKQLNIENLGTLDENESKAILAQITEQEKEQFREAFHICDKNHDGNISTKVKGSFHLLVQF